MIDGYAKTFYEESLLDLKHNNSAGATHLCTHVHHECGIAVCNHFETHVVVLPSECRGGSLKIYCIITFVPIV